MDATLFEASWDAWPLFAKLRCCKAVELSSITIPFVLPPDILSGGASTVIDYLANRTPLSKRRFEVRANLRSCLTPCLGSPLTATDTGWIWNRRPRLTQTRSIAMRPHAVLGVGGLTPATLEVPVERRSQMTVVPCRQC